MNNSKTNQYLHQLSDTIVNAPSSPSLSVQIDTIPALALNTGTAGSTTLRTTIATDDNVSTKLTSIATNTGNANTSLTTIVSNTNQFIDKY